MMLLDEEVKDVAALPKGFKGFQLTETFFLGVLVIALFTIGVSFLSIVALVLLSPYYIIQGILLPFIFKLRAKRAQLILYSLLVNIASAACLWGYISKLHSWPGAVFGPLVGIVLGILGLMGIWRLKESIQEAAYAAIYRNLLIRMTIVGVMSLIVVLAGQRLF